MGDSTTSGVLLTIEGAVATLRLDRPHAGNALDRGMLLGIGQAVADVAGDPSVRVLVVRAEGGRAFCAGADLRALAGATSEEAAALLELGQRTFAALATLPVPVIAVVDGAAVGGGLELCLACTLVVASERARFGLPEVRLGLIPGFGGTQRLPRAVGPRAAVQMALTGEPIDAATAHQLGLLAKPPVAPDALDATVMQLVDQLVANGPAAMAAVLDLMRPDDPSVGAAALARETAFAVAARESPDGREGMESFLDKRTPMFSPRPVA